MNSFIENIYDEINLTMTREDMKIPLNSIGNKNVKIETMLSTLNKHINKSDIAYIDYSVGGDKNQSINPLNELFCDNIIVFTPCLLYTSPSPRDGLLSRMPSSA